MTQYVTVKLNVVRFQVLTAASMKMAVFWVVGPCRLVESDVYVCMHVCKNVCMYACMYVYVCSLCMYACMHVLYVCSLCMYACM
jgi:hypothetical protein